jgi:predicted nucleic acid-binding protein
LPEVICNTSPLQYLHQLDLLHILPALKQSVIVPPAVLDELAEGRNLGLNLPNPSSIGWIVVRLPGNTLMLPEISDLGAGETEVLALALEIPESVAILDDALGRSVAEMMGISFTGTLGLLLDAKKIAHINAITPYINRLQELGFRLSLKTREMVLRLAQEIP